MRRARAPFLLRSSWRRLPPRSAFAGGPRSRTASRTTPGSSTAPARPTSALRRCSGSGSTSSASPSAGMRSRRTKGTYDWASPDAVLERSRTPGSTPSSRSTARRWANGGKGPNVAPLRGADFARVRRRRGRALPLRPPLDDLERAEPAALALDGLAGAVRDPPAQPGVCRDPRCVAGRRGRRRRHGSARRHGRDLAGRVHPRDGPSRRPPRRLRPPSVRALARRRRRGAAAAKTARRSRWRRSAAS